MVLAQKNWVAELEGQRALTAKGLVDNRKKWERSHYDLTLGCVIVAALTAYYTDPMFKTSSAVWPLCHSSLMQNSIATGLTSSSTTAVVQFETIGKIDGESVFKACLIAALGSALGNANIWGENGNTSLNEMAGIGTTYTGSGVSDTIGGIPSLFPGAMPQPQEK